MSGNRRTRLGSFTDAHGILQLALALYFCGDLTLSHPRPLGPLAVFRDRKDLNGRVHRQEGLSHAHSKSV